jgi:hypothetical protein
MTTECTEDGEDADDIDELLADEEDTIDDECTELETLAEVEVAPGAPLQSDRNIAATVNRTVPAERNSDFIEPPCRCGNGFRTHWKVTPDGSVGRK